METAVETAQSQPASVESQVTPAIDLVLTGLTKDFAGLRALDNVSLRLAQGEILGLIGPNGSGKTTLINVTTGLLRASAGRVQVADREITNWSAYKVARIGVARSFQVVRLFRDFTVRQNVETAAIAATGASNREARQLADAAMERMAISHLAEVPAGILPQGQERRVEIARALATSANFLLLDEPGAGLNDLEIEWLLPTLEQIRNDLGLGILIVDHDMRLIMNLCDRIHVLNYGQTIAEGLPADVRREPQVIEAYLGAEIAV